MRNGELGFLIFLIARVLIAISVLVWVICRLLSGVSFSW